MQIRFTCRAAMRPLLPIILILLASCVWLPFRSHSAVDLSAFKQMATKSQCAETRNQLFLIDDQMVFWSIEGFCADAGYSEILFGSTPDQILCNAHDSIAGPMKDCQDEQYRDLFETILAHLDEPDLGLGLQHTVQPVSF